MRVRAPLHRAALVTAITALCGVCACSTPLTVAIVNDDPAAVEHAIAEGADPNEPSLRGQRPLELAALHSSSRAAAALVAHGADPNAGAGDETALDRVVNRRGDVRMIALLFQLGADPNLLDENGWTPLVRAVVAGRPDLLEALLEGGADPNVWLTPGLESTVLHVAIQKKQLRCMVLLIRAGAETDRRNGNGVTPRELSRNDRLTHLAFAEGERQRSASGPP